MKKSTKKRKSKKTEETQQLDTDVLTYVQEELYLIEIKDLKAKLNRAQNLAEASQKLSEEYKKKYEEEVKTKEAISSYMKHCIEELATEKGHLSEELTALQSQYNAEKNQLQEKLAKSEEKYNKTLQNLQEENLTLCGKLATLEEFERQKEDLNKKLETLQTKYNENTQEHEKKFSLLQQESIMEYNRLKKEYEAKQNETKEFHISDERAVCFVTTAISEMKKLKTQLQESRKQVSKLSEENDKLKNNKILLNEKLIALECTENGLVSKIGTQKKVITMLQTQCKTQEELLKEMRNLKDSYKKLQTVTNEYKIQMDDKENIIASLSDNNIKLNEQLEFLKTRSKRQESVNIQLIIIILRAAKAIKEGILATSKKIEHSTHNREQILHQLMVIIDVSSQFYNDYYLECLIDHGIPRQQVESLFEDESIPLKYQPGDLGFIPKYEKKLSIKQKKLQSDKIPDQKLKQLTLESTDRAILSSVDLLTSYEELAQRLQQL